MVLKGIATFVQKRRWLKGTAQVRAEIVDRKATCKVDYCDEEYTYELVLKIAASPMTSALDGQFASMVVSKRIFAKYARRNNALVHYSLVSPSTFIIAGE
jgi:hypothetical protein